MNDALLPPYRRVDGHSPLPRDDDRQGITTSVIVTGLCSV
jgi:hypothetical protein